MAKTTRTGLHPAAIAGLMLICSLLLLSACAGEDGTAPDQPMGAATQTLTAEPGPPATRAETATAKADTPTARVETPSATSNASPGAEPAGTLASAGHEVFGRECAECHGTEGEGLDGPALIGENTNLPAFGTAQGLYDFIRQGMPLDAPGSLPERQYLEALAFLLLENGEVEEDTPLAVEGLDEIDLQ
ncbi:MAG TPA: cytochrome c [Anaerolineae bacterium]|nr:cytochrome c [Anaerolineae bacterium]